MATLTVPMVGPGASTSTLGGLSVDEMGFTHVSAHTGSVPERGAPASSAWPATAGATSSRPVIPDDPASNAATSSNISLSSASHGMDQTSHSIYLETPGVQETPPNSAALTPSSSRRNIFGKMFKKASKDSSTPPGTPSIPSLTSTFVPKGAGLRQSPSIRPVDPSSQPVTPRPGSAQLLDQGFLNESYDQNGTPTQMQDMLTPTPQQHPQMSPKDSRPASRSSKRASGVRGSWLIGSSNSPLVSSPLAAAFSSLGAKRRSQIGSGQIVESSPAINLARVNEETPQTASLNSAQTLSSVSQTQPQPQPQPQLSSAVLGVQPTLVVIPTSFGNAGRSYRDRRLKYPNDEKRGSTERQDDPSESGVKPAKVKEKQGKPFRRLYMYAWLARKWMKRRPPPPVSPTGYGQDQHKGFGLGLHFSGPGTGLNVHIHKDREPGVEEIVEVRFEWRRAPIGISSKKKPDVGESNEAVESSIEADDRGRPSQRSRERRNRNSGNRRKEGEDRVMRKDGGFHNENDGRGRKPSASSISSARAAVKRWSLASYQSQSTTGASEEADGQADTEDESDPEDSETPWICTLKVRRTREAEISLIPSNTSSGDEKGRNKRSSSYVGDGRKAKSQEPQSTQQEVLRIKVGTLSPTPHHPKVVAMLKVPYPLPDVQVERLGVLKRRGLGAFLISPSLRLFSH
ncbi:hypothetical protein AX15_006065 [Amanita polypyramis BW_CC]|nr:hypothetical protein AX15_006065 [Amanita polypyramis BW_CC]